MALETHQSQYRPVHKRLSFLISCHMAFGGLIYAIAKLTASAPSTPAFDFAFVFVSAVSAVFLIQRRVILYLYANIFLFVHMLTFLFQFSLGAAFMPRQHLKSEFDGMVAAVVITHFGVLLVGSMLAGYRTTPGFSAPFAAGNGKLVAGLLIIVAMIAGSIGLFGLSFLVAPRLESQQVLSGLPGVTVLWLYLLKALPYFLLLALIDYLVNRRRSRTVIAACAALLLFAAYFSNPANTPRFICLSAATIIIVFLVIRSGWISMRMSALIAPYLMLLALPVTSVMRLPEYKLSIAVWQRSFNSLEFSTIQLLADGIEMVEGDECCGNRTLSALFVLVPRSIWNAKSTGTGSEIAAANFYVSDNVAVPPFFDFFADYGFAGLVFLSLAMGYLLARIVLPSSGTPISFYNRRAMYAVMVFSLVPILVRGDFGTFTICIYTFVLGYELLRFVTSGRLVSVARTNETPAS